MTDRMHPQDLRALMAALLAPAKMGGLDWKGMGIECADALLAELEARPAPVPEDDIPARFEKFLCRMEEIFPEAGDRTELLAHAAAAKDRARAFQVALREANENRMKMLGLVEDIRACFPEGFHPELTLAGKVCSLAGESRAEGAREERERIINFLVLRYSIHEPNVGFVKTDALRAALEPKP